MKKWLIACLLTFLARPATASTITSSLGAFSTATSGSYQTIDFAFISGTDVPMNGYSEAGVTFTGDGGYLYGRGPYSGGFIYGPITNFTHLSIAGGTSAIGLDLGSFYGTTHDFEISLSTGEVFTFPNANQFVGFLSPIPITQLDIRVLTGASQAPYNLTSDFPVLYNVYVATPEPGSAALAGLGMLGLGLLRWRRTP